MAFYKLPIEIRHMIWLLSIPDDEPEVCLLWPVVLHERHGPNALQFTQPLLVDTGFPVALHVCHESRALLQTEALSGLHFRASSAAGCPVPYREFQPALDTLYWGGENMEAMARDLDRMRATIAAMPVLARVQSLAMELTWGLHPPDDLSENRALHFPVMRTISLVLPDSTSSMTSRARMGFRQPARRCKLRRITADAGAKIMVCPDVLIGNERAELEQVPLLPTTLATAMWCLTVQEDQIGYVLESEYHLEGGEEPDAFASAMEPEVIVQTFIEYQKDGSWKEVCAERTFVEFGEMVRSGPHVPLEARPDPRTVRVNDIDGDFDVVYDPGETLDDYADDL